MFDWESTTATSVIGLVSAGIGGFSPQLISDHHERRRRVWLVGHQLHQWVAEAEGMEDVLFRQRKIKFVRFHHAPFECVVAVQA